MTVLYLSAEVVVPRAQADKRSTQPLHLGK